MAGKGTDSTIMIQIAIIGPNRAACSPAIYEFGVELGKALAAENYAVICGGMAGFMEAVCKGMKLSEKDSRGISIGLVPGDDPSEANPFCDIVIPTRLGLMRNALIASSADTIIAVGGGAGTLSEIALAWQFGKRVLCVTGFGGWSETLASQQLDRRHTDLLVPIDSLEALLSCLRNER